MLRQRQEQIQLLVRTADFVVCVLAFYGAYELRNRSGLFADPAVGTMGSLAWMLAASLTLHFVSYPFLGFYGSLRMKTVGEIVAMVLKAALIEFFILGALVFVLRERELSRYFFGLFLGLNYGFVLIEKLGARILLSSFRRRGYNYRNVYIYGGGPNAQKVIHTLRRNKHWGYVPAAVLMEGKPLGELIEGVPVVGGAKDLEALAHQHQIDEVIFAPDRLDPAETQEALSLCERVGIPARVSLALFDISQSKIFYSHLEEIPLVTFYTTLRTPFEAIIKRVMDIFVSIIGLLILAVLYPWISYRIRKESTGAVIFKQLRVGENGRRFKCYKFRTMVANADDLKASLHQSNQMQGPMFKVENDPRITPFGAFLRRTSLDELPQFFNILRGDMSVVGTRPPTPDEVKQYESRFRRRLSIRPGLTGLWQVSGRSQIRNFEDVLALDLEYIDRWSIWLDLRIIAKTVWITLFGRGAY